MHIYWLFNRHLLISVSLHIELFLYMFGDRMAFIVSIFIGVLHVCEITGSSQPGALIYRHQRFQEYDGNFKPELYHYLRAATITSPFVVDTFDCVFACMGKTKCYSFNIAVFPDASGLHLCELLATDKYRASESDLQENSTFNHFSPLFPCEKNNPCQNNGACVPNFEQHDYHCDCQPGFAGNFCQRTGKTCSDIKSFSSQAVSADYVIDPDGEGGNEPFSVYCDMTLKNGVGVTVVSHDSEAQTLVNGFEGKGSYSRDVHYTGAGVISVAQLAGLTIVSTNCEQFIKYECLNSLLLNNGAKNGWWVSRNMVAMNYWGGATPADTYKCTCGVTNSCADPTRGCNCDANDSVWRGDSGLLTEKSDLPVMQLRFGDTGSSSEAGYHTLGKFKCYGSP
ncbi:neurexin-4-like isoform X1 [Oculina patagonica]